MNDSRYTNRQKAFLFLPGFILGFLSVAIRYKALSKSPFANGWDGYFYLVQLKSWIEEGTMPAGDLSLFYPFLGLNYWITGDDVTALRLSSALLAGGVTFVMYLLAKRWSGSLYLAVLVACISLFSPHLTYFTVQYPKLLLGVLVFLLFVYSLRSKQSWKPVLLFALNFFAHKLTLGLSLIFGGLMLAFKQLKLRTTIFFCLTILLSLVLSFFFQALPSVSDLKILQGSVLPTVQFAPWSFIAELGENEGVSQWWLAETILSTAVYFLSIPFLFKIEKKALGWSWFILCTFLIFPFFKWSADGVALPFFMIFILLCPLFLSLMIGKNEAAAQRFIFLGIAVLFMIGSMFSYDSYVPEKHDPDIEPLDGLVRKTSGFLQDKPVEVVIAHREIVYYFEYTTGINAMPWLPEEHFEKGTLWRIATDLRASELENYLTPEEMKSVGRLSVRYYVLPEYLWQKILRMAELENNTYLLEKTNTWKNPGHNKPVQLLK